MSAWLAVALGGAGGAVARYTLSLIFPFNADKFPVATFIANALGCLLIGVFYYLIFSKAVISSDLKPLIMVGFLGAFTTFSTFSLEVLQLAQNGLASLAVIYAAASLLVSVLSVTSGYYLMRLISA